MFKRLIETNVQGIPCLAGVVGYQPGRRARLFGPPEFCHPEEHPEVEFEILDRGARPAAWLERKLDTKARERIEAECLEAMGHD